jgi:hypothetical protein
MSSNARPALIPPTLFNLPERHLVYANMIGRKCQIIVLQLYKEAGIFQIQFHSAGFNTHRTVINIVSTVASRKIVTTIEETS